MASIGRPILGAVVVGVACAVPFGALGFIVGAAAGGMATRYFLGGEGQERSPEGDDAENSRIAPYKDPLSEKLSAMKIKVIGPHRVVRMEC